MAFSRKKKNLSPGYFGDLLFPVGDLPAGAAVTLRIRPDEKCLLIHRGDEDTKVPYRTLICFVVDNEARIRDGESPIPAEILADVPEKSEDSLTRMEQSARWMSTRWFGELLYVDENDEDQKICIMERKRSGYNLDVIKSAQASDMEKYFHDELGL